MFFRSLEKIMPIVSTTFDNCEIFCHLVAAIQCSKFLQHRKIIEHVRFLLHRQWDKYYETNKI